MEIREGMAGPPLVGFFHSSFHFCGWCTVFATCIVSHMHKIYKEMYIYLGRVLNHCSLVSARSKKFGGHDSRRTYFLVGETSYKEMKSTTQWSYVLSAGAGGAKGRKGYPSAGVVGTGSMAETAFNLGLDGRDGRAELRPRRKVRGTFYLRSMT